MGFNFSFRGIGEVSDVRKLVDFIHSQDLGYLGYHDWVKKAEADLYDESKQALLAFSDRNLVGDLIFQEHKRASGLIELKNLRIHPRFRWRDFGRFMLRQVEVEHGSYDALICDVRAEQAGMIRFFDSCGYLPIMSVHLYDDNSLDVVMLKTLDNSKQLPVADFIRRAI